MKKHVGRSGSGKSTLLHLIGGLDRPDSGKVWIDGTDIYSRKDDKLAQFRRKKIGFIFQDFNLIPSLNVWENIVLPLGLDNRKVKPREVEDILKKIGLQDKKDAMPSALSGGQKQRTAIARALVTRPAIILADEPTGSVQLVQHYPKTTPVIFWSLSILISLMTERQSVRFSSRVKVS